MNRFSYYRPKTLEEVSDLLISYRNDVRILCGGTDLTVGLRHGVSTPSVIIDIKQVADLRPDIRVSSGMVRISANTTLSDILKNEIVRTHFPALVEAANTVGSIQIRHRASLSGNICNASPAADTVPVLVVHGALVNIYGPSGERVMSVEDFILGNRKVSLNEGEFVSEVQLPLAENYGAAFGRITRRRGVDLATVNLCCGIDEKGSVVLGLGAASPRPFVVKDTSGVMANMDMASSEWKKALDLLLAQASPITDIRATATYRMGMFKTLVQRTLPIAKARRSGVFG